MYSILIGDNTLFVIHEIFCTKLPLRVRGQKAYGDERKKKPGRQIRIWVFFPGFRCFIRIWVFHPDLCVFVGSGSGSGLNIHLKSNFFCELCRFQIRFFKGRLRRLNSYRNMEMLGLLKKTKNTVTRTVTCIISLQRVADPDPKFKTYVR